MRQLKVSGVVCFILVLTGGVISSDGQGKLTLRRSDNSLMSPTSSSDYFEYTASFESFTEFEESSICSLGAWIVFNQPHFDGNSFVSFRGDEPYCLQKYDVRSARAIGNTSNIYQPSLSISHDFFFGNGESDGPYFEDNSNYSGFIYRMILTGRPGETAVTFYTEPNYKGEQFCAAFETDEVNSGQIGTVLPSTYEITQGLGWDVIHSFKFTKKCDDEEIPDSCSGVDCSGEQVYFPHPEKCNGFCQCSNGIPIEITCPPGLVFHPDLNVCVFPDSYSCQVSELE